MRSDLAEAVTRYVDTRQGASPYVTAIDGLVVVRATDSRLPNHLVLRPTLCVVVQGAKQTTVGSTTYTYRTGQALIVTVDVPGVSVITESSPENPYLSVVLELDPAAVADVLETLDVPPVPGSIRPGVFVLDVDEALAGCMLRAIQMLETPDAVPLLYPALQREICYRLLTGPHGAEVAALTVADERTPDVAQAIHTLRDRFAEPIRIDELAARAHLSPSAFYRRFKAMTSMTPLQYQKRLRLLEARRLMLANACTAEDAAHRVGYESPSQFSREYARTFGAPPRRDILTLRESVAF